MQFNTKKSVFLSSRAGIFTEVWIGDIKLSTEIRENKWVANIKSASKKLLFQIKNQCYL